MLGRVFFFGGGVEKTHSWAQMGATAAWDLMIKRSLVVGVCVVHSCGSGPFTECLHGSDLGHLGVQTGYIVNTQ